MPLLLLLLLVSVLLYLWFSRRGSSLTRTCRWRLDRVAGLNAYRCASCGAVCSPGAGAEPRHCLRESAGAGADR